MTDHPKPLQSPARNSSVTTHTPTNTLREKCRVTSTTPQGINLSSTMTYNPPANRLYDASTTDHRGGRAA